jgi:alkylation response protein AidB-like acyl-CoA dehydrogenase
LLFVKNNRQHEWYEITGQLANEFLASAAKMDEEGIFPFQNIEALKHSGYTALTVPKEYGGEGLNIYELVLLQERLAQGDGSTALSIGWHLGVIADITQRNGWSQENLERITGEVLNGALVNRAYTEAQTGSPTRGGKLQTRATKKGDKWIINGRKIFTTLAPVLDYFLVSAWIEEEQIVGEFLVPKDIHGVEIEETWDTISMRGTGSHDLILTDVQVEHSQLVERFSKTRGKQASGWLLHIPACYLGIAWAARDYAIQFANEYTPNSLDAPIKTLSNIQRLVGEIELALQSARYFLYGVAEQYDQLETHEQIGSKLGAVKHVATNTAIAVVDKAMRIVGAKSLQRTNPLQRYYRDIRSGLHNPPMDDAVIVHLANQAFEEYIVKVKKDKAE